MSEEQHVNDLDLAAFVDGGLDSDARRQVEEHLLSCHDCRRLVADAGGLLAVPPGPSRHKRLFIGGSIAAVAAALFFAILPSDDRVHSPPRTRDVDAVGSVEMAFGSTAPADLARVRADSITFSWRSAGTGATYRLTVSTPVGAIAWTTETTDTLIAMPIHVANRLDPGSTYYWQVDAVLPDLRSGSSGVSRFVPLDR